MKRILVILVMLVAMNASGQWVRMSNGMGAYKNIKALAVSGNNIYAGTFSTGIFKSTNNGESWTQTSLNNQSVTSILVNGIDLFAGAYNGVYHSTNNGETWVLTSYNSCDVSSLAIHDNLIFAGVPHYSTFGSFGLIASSNNGNTWNATSLNKAVKSLTLSGNNIFAGTAYEGIFYSTNNGLNWVQSSLTGEIVNSLFSLNNNIVAGTYYGLYNSTDNGSNWSLIGFQSEIVNYALYYGNNIFAGLNCFSNPKGVYLSTNNGTNWINKNQGFDTIPSISTYIINDNYIFAGTISQSIWRRSLSEIIGIQNISTETPSKYSLSQNYANPFNSTSNLKFQIVNTGDVKLIVYDIMGKEVQILVNERLQPGTYEAAFDGSALNSGVYFYKLITNTFSETKKMLLIK